MERGLEELPPPPPPPAQFEFEAKSSDSGNKYAVILQAADGNCSVETIYA